MKLSPNGANFIGREEGCPRNADGTLKVYNDAKGYATVGIGRLLHYSGYTAADVARYRGKTYKDALLMLAHDVGSYEHAVDALHVNLNQNEYDALVSFAYNVGTGGLASSELARYLKSGGRDRAHITALFHHWDDRGGLLRGRRSREAALFNTPVHPVKHVVRKVTPPYFQWVAWRLGEGRFKRAGKANGKSRPKSWKAAVPRSYFKKFARYLARRKPTNKKGK